MSKLKGYVAINEESKVFYIPEDNSPELAVLRVLEGNEFDIIDLSKIDETIVKHIKKI